MIDLGTCCKVILKMIKGGGWIEKMERRSRLKKIKNPER